MLEFQTDTLNSPPMPPADPVAAGELLFGEGRVAEAKAMFQAATESCPGNPQAWNNLAVIALTEGQDREAEQHLRRALEIKSDFLDARFNLVEIYCFRQQWSRAAKELTRILEIKPADLPAVKRLTQVYLAMGEPEKARQLQDESGNLGPMKAFVDSLWLGIKYYAMADDLSARDKLEKCVGAILKFLDGHDGRSMRYKLVGADPESGREVVLEDFFNAFYYKESPTFSLGGDDDEPGRPELILTIGDNEDWEFFREALRAEMKAEGGCLGDFTQSRKILRREARLAKYNLKSTLKYFQDNVGPCDCHVLRALLV